MQNLIAILPSVLDGLIGTAQGRPYDAKDDALGIASVGIDIWADENRALFDVLSEEERAHLDVFVLKVAEGIVDFIPPEPRVIPGRIYDPEPDVADEARDQ